MSRPRRAGSSHRPADPAAPEGLVVVEEGGDRGVGSLELVLQELAFLGLRRQTLLEIDDGRIALGLTGGLPGTDTKTS